MALNHSKTYSISDRIAAHSVVSVTLRRPQQRRQAMTTIPCHSCHWGEVRLFYIWFVWICGWIMSWCVCAYANLSFPSKKENERVRKSNNILPSLACQVTHHQRFCLCHTTTHVRRCLPSGVLYFSSLAKHHSRIIFFFFFFFSRLACPFIVADLSILLAPNYIPCARVRWIFKSFCRRYDAMMAKVTCRLRTPVIKFMLF